MTEYVRGRANPNLQGLLKKARGNGVVAEIASTAPARDEALQPAEEPAAPVAAPVQAPAVQVEAPQPAAAPAVQAPAAYAAPVAAPEPVQAPPVYQEAAQAVPAPAGPEARTEEPAAEPKVKMVKTSVRHTEDDAARVRATYIAAMRRHRRRSMSDWLNDVILAECARLEAELNDGQPFDEDPELPRGRPIMG